jgi:hypothetical protein
MDLGRFAVRLDLGQLVVVGPQAGGIHAGAVLEGSWGDESVHVPDVDAAVALLRASSPPATSCSSRPRAAPVSSASLRRCWSRRCQDRHP